MEISKSGLQSGNPLELLKLSWLLNSKKLQDMFDKVQVKINEDTLQAVALICENKIDVGGELKDDNGNPLMFDTISMLNNIQYTEQEIDSAKSFNYIP